MVERQTRQHNDRIRVFAILVFAEHNPEQPTQITPDVQAKTPPPTSIDQLSIPPQSTSVFTNPEAHLGEPMKTELSDPSDKPSITYQSRSLVEKIKGSQLQLN